APRGRGSCAMSDAGRSKSKSETSTAECYVFSLFGSRALSPPIPGGVDRLRKMRVWPGAPYPLGATWDASGVNFALFSENATKVELCLFNSARLPIESLCVPLPERTDMVWHGYLP